MVGYVQGKYVKNSKSVYCGVQASTAPNGEGIYTIASRPSQFLIAGVNSKDADACIVVEGQEARKHDVFFFDPSAVRTRLAYVSDKPLKTDWQELGLEGSLDIEMWESLADVTKYIQEMRGQVQDFYPFVEGELWAIDGSAVAKFMEVQVYAGKILVPPFCMTALGPESTVPLLDQFIKVKVLGLIKARQIPADIWNGFYMLLPLEFYIPKGMTVGELLKPVIEELNGLGVQEYSLKIVKAPPGKWEELNKQAADMIKNHPGAGRVTWVKGSDMQAYGVPWYKPSAHHKGSDGYVNSGHQSYLSTELGEIEVEEKGVKIKKGYAISEDEVLHFTLWREGTGLQAEGGAGRWDLKDFGLDIGLELLEEVLGYH